PAPPQHLPTVVLAERLEHHLHQQAAPPRIDPPPDVGPTAPGQHDHGPRRQPHENLLPQPPLEPRKMLGPVHQPPGPSAPPPPPAPPSTPRPAVLPTGPLTPTATRPTPRPAVLATSPTTLAAALESGPAAGRRVPGPVALGGGPLPPPLGLKGVGGPP